jgi:hypothetical protein
MAASTPTAAPPEQVFLESDEKIRGQDFVCLSFLTPRKGLLRSKDHFFFSRFLEHYAMDYKIRATTSFLFAQHRDIQEALSNVLLDLENTDISGAEDNAAARKKTVERVEKARANLKLNSEAALAAHVKENMMDFRENTLLEAYEQWMVTNHQRLEDEFHKQQNFQTTMHGLKVRGVYSTHDQAVARAKMLSKKDPYFNVYVAEVGEWLPWDPDPDDVPESEYQNADLNKLMKAYKEQMAKKDAFFEEEKRQKLAEAAAAVEKARRENPAANLPSIGERKKQIAFGEQAEEHDGATAGDAVFGGEDLALQRKRGGDSISYT